MAYSVKQVAWAEAQEALIKLREAVFVLEWQLPESAEFDDHDQQALHILILIDEKYPIATGRLTKTGEIGRVAVLPSHRNLSIYKQLFAALLNLANQEQIEKLHVQSELDSVEYHRSKGFKPIGPVYMEAGIPMQKMVCQRTQFDLPDVQHIH